MSSNVSNATNGPLLVFLRSQESCIKGSVDVFYTWLVESEDIDSMMASKEAVSDTNYLNNTMKKGNGISGLKGFKREVFQSAVQEYVEEDNGDTNNEKRVISPSRSVQQEKSGHKRSHDDLVDTPPATKRKRFTEVENAAIRLGVERFGVGKWVEIKKYYSTELIDRTTINLKDRWRTMNK